MAFSQVLVPPPPSRRRTRAPVASEDHRGGGRQPALSGARRTLGLVSFKNLTAITSAPGWWAIYGNPAVDPELAEYPLVGWAVENLNAAWAGHGDQRVFGLVYIVPGDGVVDAESARSLSGHDFLYYEHRGTRVKVRQTPLPLAGDHD